MIAASPHRRIGSWGLRDYGIEQIFGENKDCEHEWGFNPIEHDALRYRGHNANVGSNKNPEIHKGKEGSGGQDCIYCGAWKGQLGLEPTPEMYIEHLTEIFNEVKRILKKEGTLWIVIGDTYGGSGGDHKEWHKNDAGFQGNLMRGCQPKKLMPKCLCMIPERLAWSLIQDGWILRNKNIWHKRNSMPSSVKDRFSNTYEFVYMFSKNQRYYFDLDAVREPYTEPMNRWGGDNLVAKGKSTWDEGTGQGTYRDRNMRPNPDGKNPGDVFEINTQPFPEAHFAVFPETLCQKPIKVGCPEEVCKKCGKARERIVEVDRSECEIQKWDEMETDLSRKAMNGIEKDLHQRKNISGIFAYSIGAKRETIGYTDCGCNAGFESGIVLDPFCGAGTALYVAKQMRRRFIGIDIKKEYCEMAEKRLAQGVL